ncbi:MAG: multicopper oxidase domain-containing protein [Bryobacteraceae bacterium]
MGQPLHARTAPGATSRHLPSEFREPVILSPKEGVLEVRLIARQSEAALDTVSKPVKNFLLFDYELIRGTASNAQTSGKNLYPAPTLQVYPGETLIVHLENELTDLTIADYFSPEYTRRGGEVPIYPIQLKSSPLNLHVHGVHVSPKGNSDNVMLHVPAGMSNTYVYEIPKNMPQGAYWYHSHLHTLTGPQTYSPGRTAGHRAYRWQSSRCYGKENSYPEHGAAVQHRLWSRKWRSAAEQCELAAVCQYDYSAQRR